MRDLSFQTLLCRWNVTTLAVLACLVLISVLHLQQMHYASYLAKPIWYQQQK